MTSNSQALIPLWVHQSQNRTLLNILSILAGSLFLAALAQVSIPLPFTPVPITGQTLGVALLALCWGSKRASGSFILYIAEGASGLPVFALGKSGLAVGPTSGYLIGMLLASVVVGSLADRGFAKSMGRAFLCCVIGSSLVFSFGLLGLSFFIPRDMLLQSGLLPFLPGDLIKNIVAASTATLLSQRLGKRS